MPQERDSILVDPDLRARAAEAATDAAGRAGEEIESAIGNVEEAAAELLEKLGGGIRAYIDDALAAKATAGELGQVAGFGPKTVVLAFLLGAVFVACGVLLGAAVVLLAR